MTTELLERLNKSERSQDVEFIKEQLIKWRDQTNLQEEPVFTCGDIIQDKKTKEIYLIVKVGIDLSGKKYRHYCTDKESLAITNCFAEDEIELIQ